MKLKIAVMSALTVMSLTSIAEVEAKMSSKSRIERVEPLSWWVGMNTPLQLMVYGEGVGDYNAEFVDAPGIEVRSTHRAGSPNYLFIDVAIDPSAEAGEYKLRLSKRGEKPITVNYKIDSRREGSAQRESFSSKDAMFLLMPDRFANGDTSNDSTPDTQESVNRADHHGRHGGDIQGVIDHLDYIRDLGMTALWSTPMLLDDEPTLSYHGYATADYYKIDPRYGTNDLYFEMVREAHKRDIKVVMDVVTNHCGEAHWWMRDLPFDDWVHPKSISNGNFTTVSDPNASQLDKESCNLGWFDSPMPDLAMENPYLLQYFKQLFVWWIEKADLDGLRVDTFPYNTLAPMVEWVESIRAEYPNINIVGECWTSSPAVVAYWDGGAQNRDGYNSQLPSVMDFPLQEAFAYGLPKENPGWGEGMMKIYNSLMHDFLYEDPRTLMIFLDNHDIDRFADLVDGDPKLMNLGITMLATMRGVPQFYYGTEFMLRSKDRTQGHGSARVDTPGGWAADPVNLFDPADRNKAQRSVHNHTSKLFNWRKGSEVIHSGATTHFIPKDNCYVYFRHNDRGAVMVVVNGSAEEQPIEWLTYAEVLDNYSKVGIDILTDQSVEVGSDLSVAPHTSMVIEF